MAAAIIERRDLPAPTTDMETAFADLERHGYAII